MFRTIILPLIAVAGFALAIFMVIRGATPVPAAPPVAEPAQAPYKTFVVGAGVPASLTSSTVAPEEICSTRPGTRPASFASNRLTTPAVFTEAQKVVDTQETS